MLKKNSTFLLCYPYISSNSFERRNLRSRYRNVNTGSIYQQESLQDQRRSLTQAIETLRSPQRVYMPGCSGLLDNIDPTSTIDAPESTKLWLPSALPPASRDAWCTAGMPLIEFRLRYAQAVDALDHLRRLCRLVQGLHLQRHKHPTPTQRAATTRSRGVFEGLHVRIAQVSACYRDARTALLRLHPSGAWSAFLRDLAKADVRGTRPEDPTSSNSKFVLTWIWLLRAPSTPPDLPGLSPSTSTESTTTPVTPPMANVDSDISEKEVEDYMLVDWAKARERATRFEEEVELCVEEMQRTLLFFFWKASEWERCAELRARSSTPPSEEIAQGLRAYAHRQAAMYRGMVKVFVSDWHSCLQPKGLGTDWLSGYSDLITPQKGWNRIPSIIPPIPEQPEAEVDPGMLSDQDDVLDPPQEGISTGQDEESELHDNFVQVMAEG